MQVKRKTLGVTEVAVGGFSKAMVGCLLAPIVHLPRLLYTLLQLSYAAVFNNHPILTANPAEHIKRARKILRGGRLSELLYAALELRFALERMTQRDLLFAEMASNRMLDNPSPVKKVAHLQRIAPDAAFAHEIVFVNRHSGERMSWGQYKPLDKARVAEVNGRLGDLLHPKDGLSLGMWDDDWYVDTERFLNEALDYLAAVNERDGGFFDYDGLDQFEMVRLEEAGESDT